MWHRWWAWWQDLWRQQYQTYRHAWWWLVLLVVGGVVFGIVTITMGGLSAADINYQWVDGNILNMTAVNASIGGFMWQRVLSLLLPVVVVWLGAWASKYTAVIIYPVVVVHGYWVCLTLWWTFSYYNWVAAGVLLFYALWLILVTMILLTALIWVSHWGQRYRQCTTARHQLWREWWRGMACLVAGAVVLGTLEYLVFWTILGRIVYKPR